MNENIDIDVTMNIKNEILIKSPIQLFEYYLGLHPSGSSSAPLPGYIFKTSIMKKVINLQNKKRLD